MRKSFLILTLVTYSIFAVNANLLEIFRIQNQIKNSYNDIEKLQSLYKTKIKEAIMKENSAGKKDLKTQLNDELLKCREQNAAFEMLNKIYSEQISNLQGKEAADAVKMEQKEQQIQEGLETIISYTTLINEQSKQLELLQEDVKVKSELIEQLDITLKDKESIISEQSKQIGLLQEDNKVKSEIIQQLEKLNEIGERFKNLEDLTTGSKSEIDANSCVPFGESPESDAIHPIKVDEAEAFPVLCDSRLAGPGWTVVQRRFDGSVKFYRNWLEYKEGFGNLSGEFFIGLDKLHRMTTSRPHELYVHLTDFNNDIGYAHYDNIVVAGESEAYALRELGAYSGTAGDSMRDNEHQKFTTYDRDNDVSDRNCAETCLGGWWYRNCGQRFVNRLTQKHLVRVCFLSAVLVSLFSNLNGQYTQHDDYYDSAEHGIYWDEWLGPGYTMQAVQMMIRPKTNLEK